MNSINITGNVVREPELSYIKGSGTAVVNFTVAVQKQISKAKQAELKEQGKPTADFLRCVFYGATAETIANFVKKGQPIGVSGRVNTGSYEKDNVRHYTFDVVGSSFDFLGSAEKKKPKEDFPEFPDEAFFEPTDEKVPF